MEESAKHTRPVSLQPSGARGQDRATFGHTGKCASICIHKDSNVVNKESKQIMLDQL